LFRPSDVESMRWLLDLSAYDDVKAHAELIYEQLSAGSMPCDGAWPADRVALVRQWIDEGYTP
ncbi:MAG: CDGSH iron-sulfur domain-containing protein, partial [Dehalococcoidia bacterium]